MIGVFVGLVGKPTPMSGVFEDLSTFPDEDMIDDECESFRETADDIGEVENASRRDTKVSQLCWLQ